MAASTRVCGKGAGRSRAASAMVASSRSTTAPRRVRVAAASAQDESSFVKCEEMERSIRNMLGSCLSDTTLRNGVKRAVSPHDEKGLCLKPR